MKIVSKLLAGCVLAFALTAVAGSGDADQKWLGAVQKMVAKGETKVSTPSQDRVKLLQDWAGTKGYTVQVTQIGSAYRLELTKNIAKK